MKLKSYREKRDFKKSPEPKGKSKSSIIQKKKLYVIQKHAARHLHYDLRLELNGVLKSWAVPKGPCLDPNVKRLAVHVEDHPIEYGSFEGVIPEGQYGAGTVILWDTGTWESQDKDINKAYKNGNMTFSLKGKKLQGLWKLVQIKSDPKNWLLIKINDDKTRTISAYDITEKKPGSVYKHRKTKKVRILYQDKMPTKISPQLATLVKHPPDSDEWLHEVKLDGYRLICFINNDDIRLITRHHYDWTEKFPDIVKKIKALKIKSAILDGEIVALDENQKSDFQLLQNTINNKTIMPLTYFLFDLIYYNGRDLSSMSLIERKKRLQKILSSKKNNFLRYNDHLIGNGKTIFNNACNLGLEGVVSKQLASHYIQKRTKTWLKSKCINDGKFIIIGYTKAQHERLPFGSLLLAELSGKNRLRYCGHVGTGFNEASYQLITSLLQPIKTYSKSIVAHLPPLKGITWVKPVLMIEVAFIEKTRDGVLRQPSFKGIVKSDFSVTNPDKILYPNDAITKQDLATYYQQIQQWILPYIVNRPLTLLRCPHGMTHKCFYQKHLANPVDHLYEINITEKGKKNKYIYIKDVHGLLALVQLGVLEIHTWNCHVDNIEKPDLIIFDLDPAPDVPWKKVIQEALFLREQLEALNLISFVKTTGGKGIHVVIPIKRQYSWHEIKIFAHTFVKYMMSLKPNIYVGVMAKAKRKGKIYIDYLRNQKGATSIAPYSTRAHDSAPVATPLNWKELAAAKIKSNTFNINNLLKRLTKLTYDPWQGFNELQQMLNPLENKNATKKSRRKSHRKTSTRK